MNIAIITLGTNNIESYTKFTFSINKRYAENNNYTFIKYDDVLADKMREIAVEYFEKEIDNIFNKIIDK
jgi:hypothetical protein